MRYLLIISLIVFKYLSTSAQVPGTLSYQGFLTDTNGMPVADTFHSVTFRFYTQESGGTALETRGPLTVSTYKGLFHAVLGDGTSDNAPLPSALWDQEIYVGITVSPSTTELQPRVRLTTVPYAFVANSALTVPASGITGTISNTLLDDDLQDLADGTLSETKIRLNGTDASRLASGTTTQRPSEPVEGLVRYNTEEKVMEYFNGTNWYFITPKIALLTEAQPSGDNDGGDALDDTWNLRTLSTIEGDQSFVSLSNSEITLSPGEYWIDADAPGFYVFHHQLRLRAVSGASNVLAWGTSEYMGVENITNRSFITTHISTEEPLTFVLEHYTQAGFLGEGLGAASGGINDGPDIYARVKITKLR